MSDVKIKDQDYLFLSAMLRVRESKMLSKEVLERMVDAPTFDDAAKLATDAGYADMSGMNASAVEKELSKHRTEIFTEIQNIIPEKEIVDVFRVKFDYHNAKVMVKSQGANVNAEYLLSNSGRISPEKLIEAYNSEEFGHFPYELKISILEAKSVLQRTENPQLSDFILDRAYFTELSKQATKISSPFLKTYVGALADSANLSAAVRTARMKKDIDFLRKALVPGGSRGEESVALAAMSGDGVAAVFAGTAFETAAIKGSQAAQGGSLTDFELACDNAVTKVLSEAKYSGFGAEVVVGYIAAVEAELTALRMILTGKLSGVKPEKLRERLRDSYV